MSSGSDHMAKKQILVNQSLNIISIIFFQWVLNDYWLQIYPFMIKKCKYIYNYNDHRYTGWKCTPSGFVAVEMDGTFVIIFVQCFVGVTSLLAQQATQFIMVSGNFLSLLFISQIPLVFICFSIWIFFLCIIWRCYSLNYSNFSYIKWKV